MNLTLPIHLSLLTLSVSLHVTIFTHPLANDYSQLMPIHFGTDGWRAVISDTFTFANLRMVAQAIADAVRAEMQNGHGNGNGASPAKNGGPDIVVGFDARFLSDRFARDVACVLAADGLRVHLAQSDAPTPSISFAVRHLGARAGVMITASHNPPRYNGIKLKAPYGGLASNEMCKRAADSP